MGAGLLLLTLLAYARFLDSGFAATDSLPLVETSRLNGLSDAVRLFSGPVMAGTTFALGEVVYRPFVSLTFGLDHALWGMNGVGYHATNIALHVLGVLSVWLLGHQLGLRWWSSLAGAATFALHPVVLASVPVIARRDSVVPVVAFTAAAALVLAADRTCRGARLWRQAVASVLLAIALLSKESAFAAVAMLPMLVLAARLSRGERLLETLKRLTSLWPYLVLAGVLFVIRWRVLGGLGGAAENSNLLMIDVDRSGQIVGAFTRDLLWPFAGLASSTREIWQRLAGGLLVALALSLPWLPRRTAVIAGAGAVWVVGFGLFCVVLKIATIAWLAYFSLVGVALLVGGAFEGALDRLRAPLAELRWREVIGRGAALGLLAGLAVFGASSLRASALLASYDQWHMAGEVTRRYTDALAACVSTSPRATQVTLRALPSSLDDGRVETSLLGVTLLEDWTVDSALRLRFPERSVAVHVASWATLRGGAETLQFTCLPGQDTVELATVYPPG